MTHTHLKEVVVFVLHTASVGNEVELDDKSLPFRVVLVSVFHEVTTVEVEVECLTDLLLLELEKSFFTSTRRLIAEKLFFTNGEL